MVTNPINVIKTIKQNDATDIPPIPIGAEQRFVGALHNTHVNNLEEQFILGADCITYEWNTNAGSFNEKIFYNAKERDVNGYYRLITTSVVDISSEYSFYNYADNLEKYLGDGHWGIYLGKKDAQDFKIKQVSEGETLNAALAGEDASIYTFVEHNNGSATLYINPPTFTTNVSVLFYYNKNKEYAETSAEYTNLNIPNEIIEALSTDDNGKYHDFPLIMKTLDKQYTNEKQIGGQSIVALRTQEQVVYNYENSLDNINY